MNFVSRRPEFEPGQIIMVDDSCNIFQTRRGEHGGLTGFLSTRFNLLTPGIVVSSPIPDPNGHIEDHFYIVFPQVVGWVFISCLERSL